MPSGRNIRAGGAYVELYTENKRLVRGLAMAQRRLQAFAAGATAMGKKLMTASAAVIGPLTLSVRHFMRTGDALDKMSHRVGASVEFLSALSHAAEIGGTDISAMEVGIRRMQRTAMDATRGLSTATDAFDELGMSVVDSEGKLKTTEALFMESAAALSKLDNNTRKAALSTMIFGRAGTSLLPMLSRGKAGLLEVMEEAKRLGVVISTDQAKAAAAFTDVWTRLVSVLKMVVFEVGSALIPKLEELVPKIMETAQGVRAWIRDNAEAILYWAKLAATIAVVGVGLVALGAVVNSIGVIFGTVATAFTFLLAHPVVAFLAGITVAAIAAGYALNKLLGYTAKLSNEMKNAREEGDRKAAKDVAHMKRLEELAEKTSLTTAEQEEARKIIRLLESDYGKLGISINSVTGALVGVTEAQKEWNKKVAKAGAARITLQMNEVKRNMRELQKEAESFHLFDFWEAVLGGEPGGSRIETYKEELRAFYDELAVLRQEHSLFESGDVSGVTGGAAAAGGEGAPMLDGANKRADQLHQLAVIRARSIRDAMERELKITRLGYAKKIQAAKDAGESIKLIEAGLAEELAQIRRRYHRKEVADQRQHAVDVADEQRRRGDAQADATENLQYDIARLQIEADKKGLARQRALLDLDEMREMVEAVDAGVDPALIAKKYALRRKALELGGGLDAAKPETSVRGTFSAFGVRGLAAGGPLDRIAKSNQQIADDTRKLLKKARPLAFT